MKAGRYYFNIDGFYPYLYFTVYIDSDTTCVQIDFTPEELGALGEYIASTLQEASRDAHDQNEGGHS